MNYRKIKVPKIMKSVERKFFLEFTKSLFRKSQFTNKPFKRLRDAIPEAKRRWFSMDPDHKEMLVISGICAFFISEYFCPFQKKPFISG
jgi:hypothetical protein